MKVSYTLHVLGVPFNSDGRAGGVARAPDAIRGAGLVGGLADRGLTVIDRGNLALDQPAPGRDPASGIIAPAALADMIRRVRDAVGSILDEGGVPLVIGGDCPVLIGCLAAFRTTDQPGVLFIDGHEDAWPPAMSPTGEAADMELGFLLGRTIHQLPPDLIREIPRVEPHRVVVLGPRDADELANAGVPSVGDDVEVISPAAISDDPARVGRTSAEKVGADGSWWLHVDLDVLSSASLDAVDYQQVGGLTWEELTTLTAHAVRVPGLRGIDVTIFNPDLDPKGTGAEQIVRYLVSTIAVAAQAGPPSAGS
jgi:arginase